MISLSSMTQTLRRAFLVAVSFFFLTTAAGAQGYFETTPSTYGDQLFFFFDARTDRVPFLTVANLAETDIDVQVAYFRQDMQVVLAVDRVTLPALGHQIINPTLISTVQGQAGLAVVTPVAGNPLQAVVPPAQPGTNGVPPLFGSFTMANQKLGSGFGQNPFARVAIDQNGDRAQDGSLVDGVSVAYQSFAADELVIPTYFDPGSLAPASEDGNRVMLAAFQDDYTGGVWNMTPLSVSPSAIFHDSQGNLITNIVTSVDGVLFSDLESIAGSTPLTSSGKVRFLLPQFLPPFGNFFGLFSQSLGTYAIGQRMPGFQLAPIV